MLWHSLACEVSLTMISCSVGTHPVLVMREDEAEAQQDEGDWEVGDHHRDLCQLPTSRH